MLAELPHWLSHSWLSRPSYEDRALEMSHLLITKLFRYKEMLCCGDTDCHVLVQGNLGLVLLIHFLLDWLILRRLTKPSYLSLEKLSELLL